MKHAKCSTIWRPWQGSIHCQDEKLVTAERTLGVASPLTPSSSLVGQEVYGVGEAIADFGGN